MRTSLGYIKDLDGRVFTTGKIGDKTLYRKYKQGSPFLLLVMADYQRDRLELEFTGKILLDNYASLINMETAKDCLTRINGLGICRLDVGSVMADCEVLRCDVTKDVECDRMGDIITYVRSHLSNYGKWTAKAYRKEGITIENVVKTPRHKKRLIIYDKGKESLSADNRGFLAAVSNKDKTLSRLKGKIRFELNINTMRQIRELLDVPDNSLSAVLGSRANPILAVIDEAMEHDNGQSRSRQGDMTTLREYEHFLFLKECGYDMGAVEAKVRALSPKNASIKRKMEPYRKAYRELRMKTAPDIPDIDIRALVA